MMEYGNVTIMSASATQLSRLDFIQNVATKLCQTVQTTHKLNTTRVYHTCYTQYLTTDMHTLAGIILKTNFACTHVGSQNTIYFL